MPDSLDIGLDPINDLNARPNAETDLQPRQSLSLFFNSDTQATVEAAGIAGVDVNVTTGYSTVLSELRAALLAGSNYATGGVIPDWMLVSDQHIRGDSGRMKTAAFSNPRGLHADVDFVSANGTFDRVQTLANATISEAMTSYTPTGAPNEFRMGFDDYTLTGDKRIGTTFHIVNLSILIEVTGGGSVTPTEIVQVRGDGIPVFTFMPTTAEATGLTIDGFLLPVGGSMLKADYAGGTGNGLYRLRKTNSGGSFFFVFDPIWDFGSTAPRGAVIHVQSGDVYGGKTFQQTNPTATFLVTPSVFEEVSTDPFGDILLATRIEFAGQSVAGVPNGTPPYRQYAHVFEVPIDIAASPFSFAPECFVTSPVASTPTVTRTVSISLDNTVNFSAGNETGGTMARALSPFHSDYRRLRAATVRIERVRDGAKMATGNDYFAWLEARGAEGYWRTRSLPTAFFQHNQLASPAELWQRYQSDEPERSVITPPDSLVLDTSSAVSEAPSTTAKAPHMASITNLYTDAARLSANWPDWQRFEFTVPSDYELVTMEFADVFFGVDPPLPKNNTLQVYRVKIPLPGIEIEEEAFRNWPPNSGIFTPPTYEVENGYGARPESESRTAEDANASGEEFVAAARGALATDYFHDSRLTTADGQTFFYRDVFTVFADDQDRTFRRAPIYSILPDDEVPGQFALYLTQAVFQVRTGNNPDGSPVIVERSFNPAGKITGEDYRNAYQRWGNIHTGNGTDFQAPWRFFDVEGYEDTPIAAWQIGKNFRTAGSAGETLVLHLPRRISRTACFNHHIETKHAVDATVEAQQFYNFLVPNPDSAEPNSEVLDVETVRSDRHYGLMVFRNRVASLVLDLFVNEPYGNNGLAEDIRIYPAILGGQSANGGTVQHAGLNDGYEIEERDGFRDVSAARAGTEINPGDFTYNQDAGTLALNRVDALIREGESEDEFVYAWVSFRTRFGARPQLDLIYGNWTDLAYPFDFNSFRRQTIGVGAVTAQQTNGAFYHNNIEGAASTHAPWIRAEFWPLVYQKQLAFVTTYGLTADFYDYSVSGDTIALFGARQVPAKTVPGILAQVTAPEDMRLRAHCGWRSVMDYTYAELKALYPGATWTAQTDASGSWIESGTAIPDWQGPGTTQAPAIVRFWNATSATRPTAPTDQYVPSFAAGVLVLTDANSLVPDDSDTIRIWVERYSVTDFDLLEGPNWIPPRAGTDLVDYVQRLFHFAPQYARQRWEVRAVWYESKGASVADGVDMRVQGYLHASQANETRRLLEAYAEAT